MVKNIFNKLKKNKSGFTLIELIVVIVILGILAAILIPTVSGYVNNAKQKVANADAKSIYTAAVAVQAANPTITYTSYVYNDATAGDAIMDKNDINPYLGTHSSFSDSDVTITITSGKVAGVSVHEGSVTGTYTP